jgi:hypothetical protein
MVMYSKSAPSLASHNPIPCFRGLKLDFVDLLKFSLSPFHGFRAQHPQLIRVPVY